MKIETVNINSLKPHPKNPRIHPDSALEQLTKSIKEYGWTNPILVSKDGYVLAGHARLKAAEKAGLTEVPIIRLPLSGAKAVAYMIADNKLQDLTDWDFLKLKDLFDTGGLNMEFTGFDFKEIKDLITDIPRFDTKKMASQSDIEKRADELADQFKKKYLEYQNSLIALLCPECGKEFYIKSDDLLKMIARGLTPAPTRGLI